MKHKSITTQQEKASANAVRRSQAQPRRSRKAEAQAYIAAHPEFAALLTPRRTK